MARGKLGLSGDEFWDSTPRMVHTMICEWRNIEIGRNKLAAHIAAGGEVEMDTDGSLKEDITQEVDSRFL